MIQPGESYETLEVYSFISDFRQEDIPPKDAISRKKKVVQTFDKPASVFAQWKDDTDKTREQCLYEHDYIHWKLERFVKEHENKANIEKAIYDSFYFLKSCFIEMAAESAWPHLS